jgi:hypothetical protein
LKEGLLDQGSGWSVDPLKAKEAARALEDARTDD